MTDQTVKHWRKGDKVMRIGESQRGAARLPEEIGHIIFVDNGGDVIVEWRRREIVQSNEIQSLPQKSPGVGVDDAGA